MTKGSISIHVVDITKGCAARGLRAKLFKRGQSHPLATGTVGETGEVEFEENSEVFLTTGKYSAFFHVREYFNAIGYELEDIPFLTIARFDFCLSGIDDHIHLPFKFTPWGFSLFRGNP